MVARLLLAVMECYASHLASGPPSVEEVISRADVSRATFYKYFASVDDAIEQRASELVDEMVESLKSLVRPDIRPILLFALSVQLFLLRSVLDRTWAAFVARSDLLRAEGGLLPGMTMHLSGALADRTANFSDAEAARLLAIGTMRETIRSIALTDEPQRAFVDEVTTMILIGLGLDRVGATGLVEEATIFIRGSGPDRISWWRDPWMPNSRPG